jgi:prevent-host-death family protein
MVMIMTMNVHDYISVSTAKATLLEVLRRIEERRANVVITKNGMPKAVLLPYKDFEGLLETIDILADSRAMKGIKKGLKDIKSGRVVSLSKAFKD